MGDRVNLLLRIRPREDGQCDVELWRSGVMVKASVEQTYHEAIDMGKAWLRQEQYGYL